MLLISISQDRCIFPSYSWEMRNSMIVMIMIMIIIIIIIITITISDFVSIKILSLFTCVLALGAREFTLVRVKIQAVPNQGGQQTFVIITLSTYFAAHTGT
jgi:hypothetical protein